MEILLKLFSEKNDLFLGKTLRKNIYCNSECDNVKLIQKLIFKSDVLSQFKLHLNSAFSSEKFIVKNNSAEKITTRLPSVLSSNIEDKIKIDIFCLVFRAFVSVCKDNENVTTFRFFVVLCHLLGVKLAISVEVNSPNNCFIIHEENFLSESAANTIGIPEQISFKIISELLICLSQYNLNFHATEMQSAYNWLLQLIKFISNFQPFYGILMTVLSVCADIDIRLFETNIELIFNKIYAQKDLDNKDFIKNYNFFFSNILKLCTKFHRVAKFIPRFMVSIKTAIIVWTPEKIIPSEVLKEFSKTVSASSTQLSLTLFETLLSQMENNLNSFIKEKIGTGPLLFVVTSEFLSVYLKEVKLFSPNISSSTTQSFVEKLISLKNTLKTFGNVLFSNKNLILENKIVFKNYLELCYCCDEILSLIFCYKSSIINFDNSLDLNSANSGNWSYCLDSKQWKILQNLIVKSKLTASYSICFQLALQQIRISKLQKKIPLMDDSSKELILALFTTVNNSFDIFKEISPNDIISVLECFTIEDSRLIVKNLFQQMLEQRNENEVTLWFSDSVIQENSNFVKILFSEILKETGCIYFESPRTKKAFFINWFSQEYFDVYFNPYIQKINEIPEKIDYLLTNHKKLQKTFQDVPGKNITILILKVFKNLPIAYMGEDLSRLGLCFAMSLAIISSHEANILLAMEVIHDFLITGLDASLSCNIGLCIKWLSELKLSNNDISSLKLKIIEELVRSSPTNKYGLIQIADIIEKMENIKESNVPKILETQIILFRELGKCWQRGKKRKLENDLIGNYRNKLAKIITVETEKYKEEKVNSENYKILLKAAAIELSTAVKANNEKGILNFMNFKFDFLFDFAVKQSKKSFDEPSVLFLSVVLQSMASIRQFFQKNLACDIWAAIKMNAKFNWRLFSINTTEEEYNIILSDLYDTAKKCLWCESSKTLPDYLEILSSFFDPNSDFKKNLYQSKLQELFHWCHDSGLCMSHLSIRKKINMTNFFSFCIKHPKIILTSQILDTIFHVLLQFGDDDSLLAEQHLRLLSVQVEIGSSILSKQYAWNKNKVHLSYMLFKHVMSCFLKRCESESQFSNGIGNLSALSFSLEKWTSLMTKKQKDFARISSYFIVTIISGMTTVTLPPALKIHLINCLNHFLSISDSHTISYLMRTLKPGHQQVFCIAYDQFKKYHKYSGKI